MAMQAESVEALHPGRARLALKLISEMAKVTRVTKRL
jgi:hypothetical protein